MVLAEFTGKCKRKVLFGFAFYSVSGIIVSLLVYAPDMGKFLSHYSVSNIKSKRKIGISAKFKPFQEWLDKRIIMYSNA